MTQRILIIGAAGMLGHKLCQVLSRRHEVWATLRGAPAEFARYELLPPLRLVEGVDVTSFSTVDRAISRVQPDVVVNCVGVIKQLPTAKDPIPSIAINSLFPHILGRRCSESGIRMLHVSTDCVFSGNKGMYTESDTPDPIDLYGRSKLMGEVDRPGCLTLRTSIIGRELSTRSGLVEWFLSSRGGRVNGFTRAIYSGLTTLAMSRLIDRLINHHADLSGLYHVSSNPISKHDLLHLLRKAFDAPIDIEPYDAFQMDRSLDSTRFRTAIGWQPPLWHEMVQDIATDSSPYRIWRNE